ncbi:MAG: hypothetical protein QOJ37_3088 [Pseudonocardiales bacterium]|nr:hypothetical protein [Pseudonocardiales bacterium]
MPGVSEARSAIVGGTVDCQPANSWRPWLGRWDATTTGVLHLRSVGVAVSVTGPCFTRSASRRRTESSNPVSLDSRRGTPGAMLSA